ncbi:MAG: thioredoxin domain-containing protein [Bacteroidota bacterium]
MNKSILSFIFVLSLVSAAYSQKTTPKLFAFKFHADWCSTCKQMGPLFTDLRDSNLSKDDVLFHQFDFTNKSTQHQAMLMATALGVYEIIAGNTGTGFILIVDAQSMKVVQRITKQDDLKTAMSKIKEKLKDI